MIKKKLKIRILSPVHTGTGNELGQWDIVEDKGVVYVIDYNKIKIDPNQLFKDIEKGKSIKEILDKHRIRYEDVEKYYIRKDSRTFTGRGIREQIKTVNNQPYIPGSEIKGAVRTAILWWLVKNDNQLKHKLADSLQKTISQIREEIRKKPNDSRKIKSKWETRIDDEITKIVFGDEPQKDILKALYIGDLEPLQLDNLRVVETKIMSITNNVVYWKDFRNIRNSLQSKDGTSTFIEGLQPGIFTSSQIKVEDYFWKSDRDNRLGFSTKKNWLDVKQLISICKEFGKAIWNQERTFYKNLNSNEINEIKEFYKDYNSLNLTDNEFLLAIGWGTGQRAKTVFSLLEERLQKDLRYTFNLGKFTRENGRRKIIFPYSKTRKIVFENGEPKYPFGWIKVEVI